MNDGKDKLCVYYTGSRISRTCLIKSTLLKAFLLQIQFVRCKLPEPTVFYYWDVVRHKPSAFFQKLCVLCMSVCALTPLTVSCVLSLGLGLGLGNTLDQREEESARALRHGLQSS